MMGQAQFGSVKHYSAIKLFEFGFEFGTIRIMCVCVCCLWRISQMFSSTH